MRREAKITIIILFVWGTAGWLLYTDALKRYYLVEEAKKVQSSRCEEVINEYKSGVKYSEMRENFYAAQSKIEALRHELHEQDRELVKLREKLAVRKE